MNKPRIRWPRLLPLVALITAIGFLAFCVLVFHSDRTVRLRFASARWVQPAQVYAAPLELYQGAAISRQDLRRALSRLGYRKIANGPRGPGEYSVATDSIKIWRRAFAIGADTEAERLVELVYGSQGIRQLRDRDGQTLVLDRLEPEAIGSLYPAKGEDRILLQLADWPPLLSQGLLAVEDHRFYQHFGLDPLGLARAFVRNMAAGRIVEGGSTLTQQLVKNLFLTNTRSLPRKAREAVMALLLEWHFSKQAILEAYGNEVYLGQDGNRAIHGFGLGSQFWFSKPLAELNPAELALLVGMVKGPSAYNPDRRAEAALARRNLVLGVWHAAGLLDDAGVTRWQQAPLGLAPGGRQRSTTSAFLDLVRRELVRDFPPDVLTYAGLRIHTSLDPYLQALAEELVTKVVPELETRAGEGLQAALVATGVADGRIRALVGSAQPVQAGFNRALDARRPIGSLVKPAVYYTALAQPQRYNLLTRLDDTQIELALPNGDVWRPQNYDGEEHGEVPLYQALAHSYNLSTANLALELGLPNVALTLKDLGLKRPIPVVPALALGALDLSPLEVSGLYNTLAGGGYPSPLLAITATHTAQGEELLRNEIRVDRGLDARTSYLLQWALRETLRSGTGRGAARFLAPGRQLAGKTGTSDDQRDAWFAGFGSNLQTTVWVGFDDNRPTRLTGASGALPIWAQFMERASAASLAPRVPRGIELHPVDEETALPADEGCRKLINVPFVEGSLPDEKAPCAHSQQVPWYKFWR